MTTGRTKNICSRIWNDFLVCAGMFLAFCGAYQAAIDAINSIKPKTCNNLPTKPQAK